MDKQELERMLAVGSMLRSDAHRVFALIDQHREKLGTIEITMGGGSMDPAIPKGSRIRIQLDNRGPYHAGQIIAFMSKKRIMVHRIHYCSKTNYLLTCGDATRHPDHPVPQNLIVGPVIGVFHDGEWIRPPDSSHQSPWIPLLARVLDTNPRAALWLSKLF
jgi:hypothetical protein